MTVPVAFCPHPPLLFRELTGLVDVAADLRAACVAAVAGLVAACQGTVVVVGASDRAGPLPAGLPVDVRGFGTTSMPVAPADALPLSLAVGRRLLDEAGWDGPTETLGVPWDAAAAELDDLAAELAGRAGEVALLILGDGSACRGEKAPGLLDERAFGFDDTVAAALDAGDAATLENLDPGLARDLMVGGRSALRLLGRLGLRLRVEGAELTYRDDPFGVSYFVAAWRLEGRRQ